MVAFSAADRKAYDTLVAEVLRLFFRGHTALQIATDVHQPLSKVQYILAARYLRGDAHGRRQRRAAAPKGPTGWRADDACDIDPEWEDLA